MFQQEPLVNNTFLKFPQSSHSPIFQDPSEAKWKRLVKTTYLDPNGVKRTWESAERVVNFSFNLRYSQFLGGEARYLL